MRKLRCLTIALLLLTSILAGLPQTGEWFRYKNEKIHSKITKPLQRERDNSGSRATIIVDAGGSGNYTSIGEAIDASSPGDTIYVFDGVYNEPVTIDKSISLLGNGSTSTIINASGHRSGVIISGANVTLSGFEIIGDNNTVAGVNICPTGDGAYVLDNKIHGMTRPNYPSSEINASYGILVYGSNESNIAQDMTLANNEVYDTNILGISLGSFAQNITITNNTVHDIIPKNMAEYGVDEMVSVAIGAGLSVDVNVNNNTIFNVVGGINFIACAGDIQVSDNSYENVRMFMAYEVGMLPKMTLGELPPYALAMIHGEYDVWNMTFHAYIPSIQDAILGAIPGSTIIISPGTFYQNTVVNKSVTLQGTDGMSIIDGCGEVVFTVESDNVVLKGLEIVNGTVGVDVNNGTQGVEIENSTLSGNAEFGVNNDGLDEVKATYNFWGHSTGPDGLGDNVSANVDHHPWWEAPYESYAPQSSINSNVPGDGYNVSCATNITVSAIDSGSGIASVFYEIDGGVELEVVGDNVTFNFSSGGLKSVKYWAKDNAGTLEQKQTEEFFVDVVVPTADAGIDQTVEQGALVTFNGSGSFDIVGIANYTWTMVYNGTDETLYEEMPEFGFNIAGSYPVQLKVTDIVGLTAIDMVIINVTDITAPVANAGPDQTVNQSTKVFFDGTGSTDNVGIVNHTWTFVDVTNQTLYGLAPNYTFMNAGIFVVTLNVSDDKELFHTDEMVVGVNDITPPAANAGADAELEVGATFIFDGRESNDNMRIENYVWSFSYDNKTVELQSVLAPFRFDLTGVYEVTLTVMDEAGNSANDTLLVTVIEIPATEVVGLTLGPFMWEGGEPIVGAILELKTTTGSSGRYTAITDEDGTATFTETIGFGEYKWTLKKTEKGTTYSIMNGTISIDINTPSYETWWVKEQADMLSSPYTEKELDELHDVAVIRPDKPPEKKEITFLEDVPRVVHVGDEEITISVTTADKDSATLDIDQEKGVELKKDETITVDSDGDGKGDYKVTYKGEDENGDHMFEFEDIHVASDKLSAEDEGEHMIILIVAFIVVVLILILIVFRSRRKKKSPDELGDELGDEMEGEKEIEGEKEEPPEIVIETLESDQLKERVREKLPDVLKERIKTVRETLNEAKRLDVGIQEEEFISMVENLQEKGRYLEAIGTLKGIEVLLEEKKKKGERAPYVAKISDAEERLQVFKDDKSPQAKKLWIRLISAKLALEEENYTEVDRQVKVIIAGLEKMDREEEKQTLLVEQEEVKAEMEEAEVPEEEKDAPEEEELIVLEPIHPDEVILGKKGRYVEPDYDFEIFEDECEIEYHCLICDAIITEEKAMCSNCGILYESKEDSELEKLLLYEETLGKRGRYAKLEDDVPNEFKPESAKETIEGACELKEQESAEGED